MNKFNFDTLELIFSAIFFLLIAIGIWQTLNEPIINPDYIPNVITGLTTLSGILTALAGYWLSQEEKPRDKKARKWAKERAVTMFSALVIGLLPNSCRGAIVTCIPSTDICFGNINSRYTNHRLGYK